jgi:HEAT repeat protein
MSYRAVPFAVLTLVLIALAPASGRADEDEPTFLDKKLSWWLAQLQEGKDAKTRRRGMLGVEQIGATRSRKVVPALVKALQEDKDPAIRAAAARAVGRAVAKAMDQARADKKDELPRFDSAREALTKALRTEKADAVREASATALGDIGSDARGAVGALALALKDKHTPTVRAAATALRRMGRDSRDAEAELLALLGDKKADTEARTEAAIALGQIKPDASGVLGVFKEVLGDEKADLRIRKAVAEAIGKIGKDASDATATLAIILVARDPTKATEDEKAARAALRLAAVTALDHFGTEARVAIPALIKAATDGEKVVRCLSMQILGRMGKELDSNRKEAVKALLKSTEDLNVEVCVAAIESLGALSADGLASEADGVVKKLDRILTRESRKAVLDAAQAARDKIRPKPKK